MGNCLGCGKKLGIFEGYSDFDGGWCKECFSKRKELLEKKKKNEEKKEKEQKIEYKKEKEENKKERLRDDKASKLLRLNDLKLREKLSHKAGVGLAEKEKEKLIKRINGYNNFKITSKFIYFAGIIIWFLLGGRIIIGAPLLIFIIVSWFINFSRKNSLIDELKKLKVV